MNPIYRRRRRADLIIRVLCFAAALFGVTSVVTAWEMIRQGLGIGVMFRNVAEGAPGVEPVLPDLAPFDVPIWLAVHRELHPSRRIRLVFDLLAEELS